MEEIDGLKPPEKWSFKDPYVRALCEKKYKEMMPTQIHYLDHWAETRPNDPSLIEYDTGEIITWKKFSQASKAFAVRLMEYGLKRGDIIATSLPMLKEHVFLLYGCMRLGIVFATLDLRLTAREINQCFDKIKPKAFFFMGNTSVKDFRPMIKDVMKEHSSQINDERTVKYWIQFQKEETGVIEGAMHVKTWVKNITCSYIMNRIKEIFGCGAYALEQKVLSTDPCCIIFTTGSTGNAKPALIPNHAILSTNLAAELAFFYPGRESMKKKDKNAIFGLLCNLPPSHAAGLTGLLMTGVFTGSRMILLHIFDAKKSLDAIQKYKINGMAQIPACFNLQWRVENYEDYDLSSLEIGIYGGQSVSREFLVKLEKMASRAGGLYGMTEVGGAGCYTPFDSSADEVNESVGFCAPCCARLEVRDPMIELEDGTFVAGKMLPAGQIGELVFIGPALFTGYLGMPEVTKKSIVREPETGERVYYTGDLGSYDDTNTGLKFHSRRKFVMKPKGYQVFPSEVEEVFLEKYKEEIEFMACVGVKHEVYSQQIVAVISWKDKEGEGVAEEELRKIAKEQLAAYKRPSIYLFVDEFPLNRNRKRDYIAVQKIAQEYVRSLGKGEEELKE